MWGHGGRLVGSFSASCKDAFRGISHCLHTKTQKSAQAESQLHTKRIQKNAHAKHASSSPLSRTLAASAGPCRRVSLAAECRGTKQSGRAFGRLTGADRGGPRADGRAPGGARPDAAGEHPRDARIRTLRRARGRWPDGIPPAARSPADLARCRWCAPAPPGTSWRALVAACQCEPDKLTAWEAEFLASLTVSTWSTLTDKQSAALQKIADRVLRS